jgi:hypothetical protein
MQAALGYWLAQLPALATTQTFSVEANFMAKFAKV